MFDFKRFVLSLLIAALPSFASAQSGVPRSSIVSFGLWDAQSVFQLESARGARILAQDFHARSRVIVRANSPGRAGATPGALAAALVTGARGLDLENDLLIVFLTSHGSAEGIAVKIGRNVRLIAPSALKEMLAATGVRHKLIIVSACYSGVFADALADPDTLVITAADAGHPSFGCTNTARWTWFGEAFLGEALRQTRSIKQAFELASSSIARRERLEKFDPSNPQMRGGENVVPILNALAK